MKARHPSIPKQDKQIKGEFAPRVPKPRKEEAELGRGKIDIVMCPSCTAFYYEKSWHHRLGDYRQLSEDKRVKFETCPACEMIKNGKFEGQVVIVNFPEEYFQELLSLIHNIGRRAFRRDPLDRIISVKKQKGGLYVYTTENQLALSIAKQIEKAFKSIKKSPDIKWSHKEDIVRIKF